LVCEPGPIDALVLGAAEQAVGRPVAAGAVEVEVAMELLVPDFVTAVIAVLLTGRTRPCGSNSTIVLGDRRLRKLLPRVSRCPRDRRAGCSSSAQPSMNTLMLSRFCAPPRSYT
jgi:hypothetical protein